MEKHPNGETDLAEDEWTEEGSQPSFINPSAVVWILVAGAVGALLAYVAYRVFQNPQLAERAKAFFERSSLPGFIFWIVAGLFTGFLLIAASELFSLRGGNGRDDDQSKNPPST